ncbi:MAG: NUDIX hydrolase [bacterium]
MKNPLPPHAKKVFQGRRFAIWQWEQQMFDGSTATFEKIGRPDSTDVIAVTTDKKILVDYEDQPNHLGFITLPGGGLDGDETPEENARRELAEETGYTSTQWEPFMQVSPHSSVESMTHYFIAKNCVKTQETHLDPGERIRTEAVSFDDFIEIACGDTFRDQILATFILRCRLDPQRMADFKLRLGL